MNLFNEIKHKTLRKKLRNNAPDPEKIFWEYLRQRRCTGVKFRRQCSIDRYVVDFYSFERNLAVEIDGDSHYSSKAVEYDRKRTAFLNAHGINILRFTNAAVQENAEGCFELLEQFLKTGEFPCTPSNSPLQGEDFSYSSAQT